MNTIILIFLLNLSLFSQWKEIESPVDYSSLENITSGDGFLVGSSYDPYFSFDGGKSWELRNNGLPDKRGAIQKIEVDDEIVYIYTISNDADKEEYFCFSTDKGLSWNKIGEDQKYTGNMKLVDFKIQNNEIYTLSYSTNFLIKTTNLGNSWDTLTKWNNNLGLFKFLSVEDDLIVIAKSGGIVVGGGTFKGGLLVSTDKGVTWEERGKGALTEKMKSLKVKNGIIYVGGENGFSYSEDFGLTWKYPGNTIVSAKVNKIEVYNDTVFVATENGLYKARNLFNGWSEIVFFNQRRIEEICNNNSKLFVRSYKRDYSDLKCHYSYRDSLDDFKRLNFIRNISINDYASNNTRLLISSKNIYLKENFDSKFQQVYNNDTTFDVSRISIYDDNIVFTVLPTFSTQNKLLIYSLDKGKSWNKKEIDNIENNLSIKDLFLLNNDTLLITNFNNGVYLSYNFNNVAVPLVTEFPDINSKLYKVNNIFRQNNNIFYVGEGTILESDIYLKNWKSYTTNINSNVIVNDFSKDKEGLFAVLEQRITGNPSKTDLFYSNNEGDSWVTLKEKFNDYGSIRFKNVLNINKYVLISTDRGIYFSKDNGKTFNDLNVGINKESMLYGGDFYLEDEKIIFCSAGGIYYVTLEDLDMNLKVENTEKRNYLYTFPPFPQPTRGEIKIKTFWDSGVSFTQDDVNLYDINGSLIDIIDFKIVNDTYNTGHIIFDTSNLYPGVYYVKINHGTEMKVCKILVD